MRVTAQSLVRWALPLLSVASLAAAAEDLRLAEAVKNRDMASVRVLLTQHVDVDARLPDGTTALHWAAHWDNLEAAGLLIAVGAQVNATDDYGVTPLSLACTNGSGAMIETLLKAGANPNLALPTGETPLMTAARTGNVDAVRALLERGADVSAVEASRGQDALMWAAAEGHAEVARLLTEQGADAHARSKTGFTPLLFAAQKADRDTTRVLLGAGVSVNEAGSNGATALVVATTGGHTAFAELLLDHGADPNLGPGFTPLHVVARHEEPDISDDGGLEKLEFIKLLLARGADPNARATRAPAGVGTVGATPFFLAAWAADVDTMRLLLGAGADPMLPTTGGTTPLMAAAGFLHSAGGENTSEDRALEAVKLCVELGHDVNAANTSHGDTALHAAAYRGKEGATSIVQFLVDHGAKVNVTNKRGWTPLLIAEGLYFSASNTLHVGTIELLRKLGADPSPPNYNRNAGIRSGEIWYEPGQEPARHRAAQ